MVLSYFSLCPAYILFDLKKSWHRLCPLFLHTSPRHAFSLQFLSLSLNISFGPCVIATASFSVFDLCTYNIFFVVVIVVRSQFTLFLFSSYHAFEISRMAGWKITAVFLTTSPVVAEFSVAYMSLSVCIFEEMRRSGEDQK